MLFFVPANHHFDMDVQCNLTLTKGLRCDVEMKMGYFLIKDNFLLSLLSWVNNRCLYDRASFAVSPPCSALIFLGHVCQTNLILNYHSGMIVILQSCFRLS